RVRASPGASSTTTSPIWVDAFAGAVTVNAPESTALPVTRGTAPSTPSPGNASPILKPSRSGAITADVERVSSQSTSPVQAASVSLIANTGSVTVPGSYTERSARAVTSTGRD